MGFGPILGDRNQVLHPEMAPAEEMEPIRVVTSGDIVFEGLAKSEAHPFDDLGVRCTVFGNGKLVNTICRYTPAWFYNPLFKIHLLSSGADDEEYVRKCGKIYSPIEQADFILARGLFTILGGGSHYLHNPFQEYSVEEETRLLQIALSRKPGGLPLLVANPDTVRPDGEDSPMPGLLAERYSKMGATDIRLIGKPHPLIYEACRQQLADAGIDASVANIAAVGDSLHHDVLGANRNGIDSIFIAGGVHYRKLGVPQSQAVPPDPIKLEELLAEFERQHQCRPTLTLPGFVVQTKN